MRVESGYHAGMREARLAVKRAMDVLLAGGALVVFSPLMAMTAAVIAADMGRPVVFAQRRPGRGEAVFTVYKFRTMSDARDESGALLPDDVRLTRLGRWLRRLSLDELPQLWNVLRGDMSIVGPRPLTIGYLPYYRPRERRRFEMRPGITGLAQVRGRNTVGWDERLGLDAEYVERFSIALDLEILAETVVVVLTRRGAVDDPRSIMLDLDQERADEVSNGA